MQTPATTMRAPAARSRMILSRMPGTPTHSKTTAGRRSAGPAAQACDGRPKAPRSIARDAPRDRRRRAPPSARPARGAGEKSAATIGSAPRSRSAAITARPTGPQPTTSGASSGSRRAFSTACKPTAIGSVSAACSVASPFGTGQHERRRAPSARRSRRGPRSSSRRRRRRCRGTAAASTRPACRPCRWLRGVGTVVEHLGAELVAHDHVARRDPCTNGAPLSRAASTILSACVERVQVGAADAAGERLDQHLAGAGLGIGNRVDDELLASHDGGAHRAVLSRCDSGRSGGERHRRRIFPAGRQPSSRIDTIFRTR